MFGRRRRHGHGLIGLILALLGFKWVSSHCCDEENRGEMKAKATQFRSKMKEAFAVWHEEPAAKQEPASDTGTEN